MQGEERDRGTERERERDRERKREREGERWGEGLTGLTMCVLLWESKPKLLLQEL